MPYIGEKEEEKKKAAFRRLSVLAAASVIGNRGGMPQHYVGNNCPFVTSPPLPKDGERGSGIAHHHVVSIP